MYNCLLEGCGLSTK